MRITVERKYLKLPVNPSASLKMLSFLKDEKAVYDAELPLDNLCPTSFAFLDLSRFLGEELTLQVEPDMPVNALWVDDIDLEEKEYRPFIHFATRVGWINDPNGLVKRDGTYHMFYQHNPGCINWGTMHWGHATSTDLYSWTHQPIALFPDELGAMYSGSAITDEAGVSGLGERPTLLYYTAAAGSASAMSRGKKFTQCIAYSEDMLHFKKYEGNPIIQNIRGANRDPKVVYAPELSKYVIVLYIDGHDFSFFVSDDLINWSHFQDFSMKIDRECPDFIPFEHDGERLWAFIAASDYYVIGRLDEAGFHPISEEKKLSFGAPYAAQTFSGTDKITRIYWLRISSPSAIVSQQMSLPLSVELCKDADGYYLKQKPVEAVDQRRGDPILPTDGVYPLKRAAYDLEIRYSHTRGGKIILTLFGNKLFIDMNKNELACKGVCAPIPTEGEGTIRAIVDRNSIECFIDGGRTLLASAFICDYNLPYLTVKAEQGASTPAITLREYTDGGCK